jgi:hypothetical protein
MQMRSLVSNGQLSQSLFLHESGSVESSRVDLGDFGDFVRGGSSSELSGMWISSDNLPNRTNDFLIGRFLQKGSNVLHSGAEVRTFLPALKCGSW